MKSERISWKWHLRIETIRISRFCWILGGDRQFLVKNPAASAESMIDYFLHFLIFFYLLYFGEGELNRHHFLEEAIVKATMRSDFNRSASYLSPLHISSTLETLRAKELGRGHHQSSWPLYWCNWTHAFTNLIWKFKQRFFLKSLLSFHTHGLQTTPTRVRSVG